MDNNHTIAVAFTFHTVMYLINFHSGVDLVHKEACPYITQITWNVKTNPQNYGQNMPPFSIT